MLESTTYTPQYAYRAQKVLGVVDGPTAYRHAEGAGLGSQQASAKYVRYDPSGRLVSYVVGNTIHIAPTPSSLPESVHPRLHAPVSFELAGVIDLAFSPQGNFLFTWERLVKVEDGEAGHKNLKIWFIAGAQVEGGVVQVGGFAQKSYDGWCPQMTLNEAYLIRLSGPSEISIFGLPAIESIDASTLSASDDVKQNSDTFGLSSPCSRIRNADGASIRSVYMGPATGKVGGSEGIAVWLGEYKGAPAILSLYTLKQLIDAATMNQGLATALPPTQSRKSFFKGSSLQVKWNQAGTALLMFTQSDVDNSGKSYYGETNLYLISLNGAVEAKVALDKEGPIYDFDWNPNSKEFAVVYGFMPARTVLFDIRANPVHSFGPQPRNFVRYQPQGRLFISAGFGNLTGMVDIWDLRTRTKICEFSAPNSTMCEWSPCGRYILTATLSPRLRVDNGVKIWWCAGGLLHVQPVEELYQVVWRPAASASLPAFPAVISPAPGPSQSVAQYAPSAAAPTPKPAGAYRPPGARGTLTPTIYRREDEGGSPSSPSGGPRINGAVSPASASGIRTPRRIPGAPPPGAAPSDQADDSGKKKKKGKKGGQTADKLDVAPSPPLTAAAEVPAPNGAAADGAEEADKLQKKIRNLTKKLNSIYELKEKRDKGEALEATQLKKIDGEKTIKQEVAELEAKLKAL